MFEFRPTRDESSEPYNSIRGGNLKSKFTIHERANGYKATSANGNSELIDFLDSLNYLSNNRDDASYSWWDVDVTKVVSLQNDVMNKFT